MKKLLILAIFLSTPSKAEYCPSIENDTQRLACFDRKYPDNSDTVDPSILEARSIITTKFKLNDPRTIMFRNEKIYYTRNNEPGTVCGELNSKDSKGIYMGYRRYFVDVKSNFLKQIETTSNESFKRFWDSFCK